MASACAVFGRLLQRASCTGSARLIDSGGSGRPFGIGLFPTLSDAQWCVIYDIYFRLRTLDHRHIKVSPLQHDCSFRLILYWNPYPLQAHLALEESLG
jgi:hypothetical protein